METEAFVSGFACLDTERQKRTGYPEVVYCAGKTETQAFEIISALCTRSIPVLATRAEEALALRVTDAFPGAVFDKTARTLTLGAYCDAKDRRG
jgi:NCAIR mutase (PurE)-related protein